MSKDLRRRVFTILERSERSDFLGRLIDGALVVLIAVNVISVILETVDEIYATYQTLFWIIELVSVTVFTIEYLLRVWSCTEAPVEVAEGPISNTRRRIRYMLTPLAVIDLIAILPFFLSVFFVMDLRFLRVLRLLRVFKLTRYSSAMTMLLNVFREELNAFMAAFFIMMVLLVIAASGAYLAEHGVQPDKFGSIPHAMWWAMATLTTVGYGDVTPVTGAGKVFGSMIAILGIGMAALPAGILASGLADQLRRSREELATELRTMLEDGIIDENEERELEELRKDLGLSKRVVKEVLSDMHEKRLASMAGVCPHCGGTLHDRKQP